MVTINIIISVLRGKRMGEETRGEAGRESPVLMDAVLSNPYRQILSRTVNTDARL